MVNRISDAVLAFAATLLLAAGATAADAPDKAVEAGIRAKLELADRGLKISGIEKSEIPGLYVVQYDNGPVVYATETGDYFILGDLHEVTAKGFENLTEKRRDTQRAEQLAQVKPEDMIVFSPQGETRAHITVFTDTTCFYCQKLHKEVPELNKRGVEVRYLAYPRGGPGSEGFNQLVTAWCAKDREDTLTRLKAKESVPSASCPDNPVAAQFQLGQQMGVRGTPALVTESGQMIPGYQTVDQLMVTLGLE